MWCLRQDDWQTMSGSSDEEWSLQTPRRDVYWAENCGGKGEIIEESQVVQVRQRQTLKFGENLASFTYVALREQKGTRTRNVSY